MTKMYLITDHFRQFAAICNSLEECKEEYLDYILDSHSCADDVLIADATKIEEFSNFSAECVFVRYEGDTECVYYPKALNDMDNFKNEMAHRMDVCKNEKIECEMFALTNFQRFKSKITISFEVY